MITSKDALMLELGKKPREIPNLDVPFPEVMVECKDVEAPQEGIRLKSGLQLSCCAEKPTG